MVYDNNEGPIYSTLTGKGDGYLCQPSFGCAPCYGCLGGPNTYADQESCISSCSNKSFKCGTMNFTCWYDEGASAPGGGHGATVWEMRGGTGCFNGDGSCPLGGQYEVGSLPPTPCTEGATASLDMYCPGI
jgi:hypothetical protein